MTANQVKVGIVGLGRWAKVLTRAAVHSDALRIVAGHEPQRGQARGVTGDEFGVAVTPDLPTMLADPAIQGVILTVPNEQHLPLAREVAKAGKHVYTEKPIASTLEEGLEIEALEKTYGVTVTVGHSARLMAGIRKMREAIDAGELGRVGFIEANFSNERALELTPKMWRWYKDRAPGGPLSQLAIHHFDVVHYLGGEIVEASSMASKLSPVGAEVDDQSMTLIRFADGKIGYVGASWTSPGVFAVRVFGSKGLMHYEIDFGTWDTPSEIAQDLDALHPARQGRLRQARGIADSGERHVPRRARDVRGELPHRQGERADRAQRQCRGRGGLCGARLDRAAGPRDQDRRRHRGRPQEARRAWPTCCLAAIFRRGPSVVA